MTDINLILSDEEQFELKQALEGVIKREREGIAYARQFAVMNQPGGVADRGEHSVSVLVGICNKLP